jgi:hypothetical protein
LFFFRRVVWGGGRGGRGGRRLLLNIVPAASWAFANFGGAAESAMKKIEDNNTLVFIVDKR